MTLARRQLQLALEKQASAQEQVNSAQEQVDMALEDLRTARVTGDEAKVEKAEEKVEKAEEKVEKAEEKVAKAEEKVKEAKKEVEKAEDRADCFLQVDRDATAFANELASIGQPEALNAGVQLFKLNRSLTAEYRMSGTAMLSRKTMRVAWDAVFQLLEQDKMDRIAMVGMPGIGKSRSLFYGLWRLMTREVPPVVVFEARRRQKVFIFTWQNNQWVVRSIAINNWIPANCKYLDDERNFYLIDAFAPEWSDATVSAKAIKACSPDRKHHSGFVKDGGTYVYVEAWSAEEVEAAHPYLEGAPELTEMLDRFEQVGGNLRVLLSNDSNKSYGKYVFQQKSDADKFETLRTAIYGDLDSQGENMLTRLFTYLSKDGTSWSVGFASPGATKMVRDAHYDELMKVWSNPNDPKAFYLLEQFAGTIFTSSLLEGRPFERFNIERSDGGWTYEPCGPLIPGGRQLLECDAERTFDDRWREAVRKGDLGEVLLHSPNNYPGIDYLLDFNHGIQVTQSDTHSIAPKFLEKLRTAFDGHKGYNFTLTFMVVKEPTSFKPKSVQEYNGLMKLAQGKEPVFSKVWVDVIQMPQTRDSLPKKKCCKGSSSKATVFRQPT